MKDEKARMNMTSNTARYLWIPGLTILPWPGCWPRSKGCRQRFPSHIITANVDHLILKRKFTDIEEIFHEADLIVPDGVPLLWAARFLGTPLRERINGTDLMEQTCELAAKMSFPSFCWAARKDRRRPPATCKDGFPG